MNEVVVDASVALAWLFDERRPEWVDRLMKGSDENRPSLTVPTLFWLEVGNRVAQHHRITDDQALDGMFRLEALGIRTIELDRPLRLRSLLLAREQQLTMYDAAYLALANSLGVPLATLDHRLDAAAGDLSFAGRPHRASEAATAYAAEPDEASVAAIGAAIAELRRELQSA